MSPISVHCTLEIFDTLIKFLSYLILSYVPCNPFPVDHTFTQRSSQFQCTFSHRNVVIVYMEDIACPRVETNFIFECSTRYLMSERSERVRYGVKYEIIKFVSTRGHVILCLLYEHTNYDVFEDFPKFPTAFRRFLKIVQNCSEGQTNVSEHFRTFSEDQRRLPKTTEEVLKRFRSYINKFMRS